MPADGCLAHLGISSLLAPPAPPAFHRFAADLAPPQRQPQLQPRGNDAGAWSWYRSGEVCSDSAADAAAGRADPKATAAAAATATALRRHLGPPLPYNGYTTPSGKLCRLAPGDSVHRLLDPSLESFLLSLFRCIEQQRAPMVSLGPHCLFHAHLFAARPPAPPGLGLLFHACEYPDFHEADFPYRLGHCQEASRLRPTGRQMAQRNLLWYQDRLVLLDVSSGLLLRHLLWEETSELCTLYEEDFGTPLLDLTLDLGHDDCVWEGGRSGRMRRSSAGSTGPAVLISVRTNL
ncbi:hypothetical protein PLESTF_001209400 [Pleodorina starrii]|nr:hypothetical protein PLESTF_001209400 [Pleodorina starrii]